MGARQSVPEPQVIKSVVPAEPEKAKSKATTPLFSKSLLSTIERQYPGMQQQTRAKIQTMSPAERRMLARAHGM